MAEQNGIRTDRDMVMRAFTFFQDAANGAGIQTERIQGSGMNDAKALSQLWFDWQALMTHLWRMRKAALLIGKTDATRSKVQAAIADFDKAIPNLKLYRDVFEHMDAYIFEDQNRHYKHIGLGGLQVGMVSNEVFSWAIDKKELRLNDVAMASSKLYGRIKSLKDALKSSTED